MADVSDMLAVSCFVMQETIEWPACARQMLSDDLNRAVEGPDGIIMDGTTALAGPPIFDVLKKYGLISDISTEGDL